MARATEAAARAAARRGQLNALVVDDEAHVRVYVRLILGALGITEVAVIAVSAESKLDVVRTFQELGAVGYVLKHSPRAVWRHQIAETIDGVMPDE